MTAVTIPRSAFLLGTAKGLAPEIIVKRLTVEGQVWIAEGHWGSYSFNFYEYETLNNKKMQVAVVYEMEKASSTTADAAIKASLASLGADTEVYSLRQGYDKMNRNPQDE